MIEIKMEWTDTGAKIKSSIRLNCPACGAVASPGVEHVCGEYATLPKPKKARKRENLRTD